MQVHVVLRNVGTLPTPYLYLLRILNLSEIKILGSAPEDTLLERIMAGSR